MSKLYAFLNPEPIEETKEVIISNRFKDENGNVIPFVIRTISQEENNRLINKSRKIRKENGVPVEYLDHVELTKRLAVAAVKEPDFTNKELCDRYGTLDPLEVPCKMLRSGEFNRLMEEIRNLAEKSGDNLTLDDAKN